MPRTLPPNAAPCSATQRDRELALAQQRLSSAHVGCSVTRGFGLGLLCMGWKWQACRTLRDGAHGHAMGMGCT